MEDEVVHVGEGAEGVEEELGAVLGPDGDHGVALLVAVGDADVGGGAAVAVAAGEVFGSAAAAVVVHKLVEPPVAVVGHGHGDLRGGGPGGLAVAAEDVAEELADGGDPRGVLDGRAAGGVAHVEHRRRAGIVGPNLGLYHVAAHVPEHGADLREEARPVSAGELDRGQAPARRRRRGQGGGSVRGHMLQEKFQHCDFQEWEEEEEEILEKNHPK